MAKAVLVMDMPEDCAMCKFCDSDNEQCYAVGADSLSVNLLDNKPVFCPLCELPEYKRTVGKESENDSLLMNMGWNACMDAIDPR